MTGITSLIPLHYGGLRFDGHQIYSLLKGGILAEHDLAIMTLETLRMSGSRPSDLPDTLIRKLLLIEDAGQQEVLGHYLLFLYHADRGEIDTADLHLARALELREHFDLGGFGTFMYEAAFHAAFLQDDPETARRLFEEAQTGFWISEYVKPMAEAALLLAEDQIEDAKIRAREAITLLNNSIDRGSAILAADWLDDLLLRIQTAEGQS